MTYVHATEAYAQQLVSAEAAAREEAVAEVEELVETEQAARESADAALASSMANVETVAAGAVQTANDAEEAAEDARRVATQALDAVDAESTARTLEDSRLASLVDVVRRTPPKIGDNGNWLVYDDDEGVYVDTGIAAKGEKGDPGVGDVTKAYVDAADNAINSRIDSIEAMAHPNINIVGSPKFNQGNISGFSANDYLVFPTAVDVGQDSVDFYLGFSTGSNVSNQQNLLDSWCGLAFAVSGGRTITAASQNGTTFITSESASGMIDENSSYTFKFSFRYENGKYNVDTYIGYDFGWMKVCPTIEMTAPLHKTATYWGGANPANGIHHIFGGTINLNACRLDVNGETVWRGYSELNKVSFNPNATPRLDTAEKIVKVVEDAVSLNNRFLVGATSAAIQTRENEEAEWADEIRVDKGYDALTGETVVKLDKSVQSIVVSGETTSLDIELPDAVDGTVRDLCLYVSNTTETDCALNIPDGTYYGDDPNGAVAKAGQVTVLYFTEIPVGAWLLRIVALDQHKKPQEATA